MNSLSSTWKMRYTFFAVCLIKLPRDVNTVGVSHSNIVREIDILRPWHNYSHHSTTNFNRNYSTDCKILQLLNMPFTWNGDKNRTRVYSGQVFSQVPTSCVGQQFREVSFSDQDNYNRRQKNQTRSFMDITNGYVLLTSLKKKIMKWPLELKGFAWAQTQFW